MTTTHHGSGTPWSELKHKLGQWRRCARSQAELMSLNDHALRDIGLSRCDVEMEARKSFWLG